MSVTVDKDGLVISIDWGDYRPRNTQSSDNEER